MEPVDATDRTASPARADTTEDVDPTDTTYPADTDRAYPADADTTVRAGSDTTYPTDSYRTDSDTSYQAERDSTDRTEAGTTYPTDATDTGADTTGAGTVGAGTREGWTDSVPSAAPGPAMLPDVDDDAMTVGVATPAAGGVDGAPVDGSGGGLIAADTASDFTRRWEDVQALFLDSPKQSVEGADRLIVELMDHVSERFAAERLSLESRWSGGEEANTEDLRVTLQRYRDVFKRLLAS
jgi:hypothetical protein